MFTQQDAARIREFVHERRSCANISTGRVNKITDTLVGWRRFIGLNFKEKFAHLAIIIMKRFGRAVQNPYPPDSDSESQIEKPVSDSYYHASAYAK